MLSDEQGQQLIDFLRIPESERPIPATKAMPRVGFADSQSQYIIFTFDKLIVLPMTIRSVQQDTIRLVQFSIIGRSAGYQP